MLIAEGSFADGDLTVARNNTGLVKAQLAGRIVEQLDARELTVRSAGELTSTPPADFSRIRRGRLDRFTVDRLISILSRLDQTLEISLLVRSVPPSAASSMRRRT